MDKTKVQLGNQVFFLDTSTSASERRARFFDSLTQDSSVFDHLLQPSKEPAEDEVDVVEEDMLTQEEVNLLAAVGLYDKSVLQSMAPHMVAFFDSLPNCSTDTSILLKKDCDTAFYVLWSVLFQAQKKTKERLEKNKKDHPFLADIHVAQTEAIVRAIQKTPHVQSFDRKDVMKLFTVSLNDPGAEAAFVQLLTLMDSSLTPENEEALQYIFRFVPLQKEGV